MSKPMIVTLPVILLLLDYWPLGEEGRMRAGRGRDPQPATRARNASRIQSGILYLAVEKLPFVLLALLSELVTLRAAHR